MATGGEGTGSWWVKDLELVKDQRAWLLSATAIAVDGCAFIPVGGCLIPRESGFQSADGRIRFVRVGVTRGSR